MLSYLFGIETLSKLLTTKPHSHSLVLLLKANLFKMIESSEKKSAVYKDIFDQCDTDKSGEISLAELKHFIRTNKNTHQLNDDQITYIFSMGDKNDTKSLSYDEFVNLLENPKFRFLMAKWTKRYINFILPPQPVKRKTEHVESAVAFVSTVEASQQVSLLAPHMRGRSYRRESQILFVTEDDEFSYAEAFTCCPPPLAMIMISILEIICFVTDEAITPGSTLDGSGVTAQMFLYMPQKRQEAWRFLTYMLVHIGRVHIIVNLAVQLLLGIPLEMVNKWWRVCVIYFSGVVAGSLATSITDPWTCLAGASGGVYALLTAHISAVIMNWSEMSFPGIQLAIFAIIITLDMGTSIRNRYYLKIDDQVSFVAHFGGAIAGLLVGIYILKNLNIKTFENYLWWVALIVFILLTVIAVMLNIFLPGRYPTY